MTMDPIRIRDDEAQAEAAALLAYVDPAPPPLPPVVARWSAKRLRSRIAKRRRATFLGSGLLAAAAVAALWFAWPSATTVLPRAIREAAPPPSSEPSRPAASPPVSPPSPPSDVPSLELPLPPPSEPDERDHVPPKPSPRPFAADTKAKLVPVAPAATSSSADRAPAPSTPSAPPPPRVDPRPTPQPPRRPSGPVLTDPHATPTPPRPPPRSTAP
ncbi:MAG: hypothetical protein AAF715_29215 [Myxococcota bacterium]